MCACLIAWCFSGCRAKPGLAEDSALPYVVETTGGAGHDEALPLLIVLHGLGDRPAHFIELFSSLPIPARVVAVQAPRRWGEGFSWYPMSNGPEKWSAIKQSAARVVRLARELARRFKTVGKPVVTGFSQGGVLSFAIAARHPNAIAAALPIAGTLDPAIALSASSSLPRVLAFHGDQDERIPIAGAERAVARLKRRNYPASLTTFAGLGHSISNAMRDALFASLRETLGEARATP